MGFGFQILKLESCKPELKDCRKKSSQYCFFANIVFLNAVENIRYEVLNYARSNDSIIFDGRIILSVDGKLQIKIRQKICRQCDQWLYR